MGKGRVPIDRQRLGGRWGCGLQRGRVMCEATARMGVLGMIELGVRDFAIDVVMIVSLVIVVVRDELIAVVMMRTGVVKRLVEVRHDLHAEEPEQARHRAPCPTMLAPMPCHPAT